MTIAEWKLLDALQFRMNELEAKIKQLERTSLSFAAAQWTEEECQKQK